MTASLEAQYQQRYENILEPISKSLEALLREQLEGEKRIDRIVARAKSVDRFLAKAAKVEDGATRYSDPLNEIQDQIGARIVTFYVADVARIKKRVRDFYHSIEQQKLIPEKESEFSYIGEHFVLLMPSDALGTTISADEAPKVFELQIKTLFQHAWSEANHDLGYKPDSPLSSEQKRQIAFTAAQSWGADHILDRLFEGRVM